jgi:stage II sporulation protein E
MKRDRSSCVIKEGTNLCYFKLVEALKYQVSTGIAREVKDEGGLSGDNYSFIELRGGKYMMALSDGMGTGPAAAMESNSAITLLEKYLEAGFDKSTALRAINSAMSLRSPEDNFTTMDLCITDLYTGEAELIKIGAASTFIQRYDGTCETIFSTTLPIGIVNNLEYEVKNIKLAHGDLIVMITDGVQEAGGAGDGNWVVKALEEIDSRNVQQVAEQLLSKAKDRNGGEITDDMTVLVSKIWEVI